MDPRAGSCDVIIRAHLNKATGRYTTYLPNRLQLTHGEEKVSVAALKWFRHNPPGGEASPQVDVAPDNYDDDDQASEKAALYLMMRGVRDSQVSGRIRPLLSVAPAHSEDEQMYMAKDDRTTDFYGGIKMGPVLTVDSLEFWVEDDAGVPLVDKSHLFVHLLWKWQTPSQ
jgi:hypothetical protein